jgi:hypothetical protein
MLIQIAELKKVLFKLKGTIPSSDIVPVCQNILTREGELFSYDFVSSTRIEDDRFDHLIGLFPKIILDLIQLLPEENIYQLIFDEATGKLILRSEREEYKISIDNPEHFPAIKEQEPETFVTIDDKERFVRYLSNAISVMNKNSDYSFHFSTTAVMNFLPGKIEFYAVSEGNSFVIIEELPANCMITKTALFSETQGKTLLDFLKNTSADSFQIGISDEAISIKIGTDLRVTMNLKKEYPFKTIEKIRHTDNIKKPICLAKNLIITTVKRINIFNNNDRSHHPILTFSNQSVLFCIPGELEERIPLAKNENEEELKIQINAKYVQKIIEILTGQIEINFMNLPYVIRLKGEDEGITLIVSGMSMDPKLNEQAPKKRK